MKMSFSSNVHSTEIPYTHVFYFFIITSDFFSAKKSQRNVKPKRFCSKIGSSRVGPDIAVDARRIYLWRWKAVRMRLVTGAPVWDERELGCVRAEGSEMSWENARGYQQQASEIHTSAPGAKITGRERETEGERERAERERERERERGKEREGEREGKRERERERGKEREGERGQREREEREERERERREAQQKTNGHHKHKFINGPWLPKRRSRGLSLSLSLSLSLFRLCPWFCLALFFSFLHP